MRDPAVPALLCILPTPSFSFFRARFTVKCSHFACGSQDPVTFYPTGARSYYRATASMRHNVFLGVLGIQRSTRPRYFLCYSIVRTLEFRRNTFEHGAPDRSDEPFPCNQTQPSLYTEQMSAQGRMQSPTVVATPFDSMATEAVHKESDSISKTGSVQDVQVPPPEEQGPRDAKFWIVILSLCIGIFLTSMEFTAIGTVLPVIVSDLHGQQFIWVGSAYTLGSTAPVPFLSTMSQVFGRKPIMLLSILLFAVGSAICGAASSMSMLIAGRGRWLRRHQYAGSDNSFRLSAATRSRAIQWFSVHVGTPHTFFSLMLSEPFSEHGLLLREQLP
ncbi:major facilitator superfamily domain-containing protein [Gloeopeniophorella convolvens]|nr:major facilitator superfamily domain-containing protein [Gloeopeniophorella convolvens]